MKRFILMISAASLLAACGGNSNEVSVHKRIDMYEDSIQQWGGGLGTKEEINAFADDYIATLLEAAEEEPENPKTPEYLDRVHMWSAAKEDYTQSLKWAKEVVEKYPKYVNREMVLESIASMYDINIQPRDSAKVKEYYTIMLKEFPNLNQQKKQDIKDRLKYNHLTFKEYQLMQEQKMEAEIQ